MQAQTWIGFGTGLSGLLTAAAMALRVRSQNRVDDAQTESVDRAAITQAIETVQTVYTKLTGDLREQVDDLLARDKECRAEMSKLQTTVKAQDAEMVTLQMTVRAHASDLQGMRARLAEAGLS